MYNQEVWEPTFPPGFGMELPYISGIHITAPKSMAAPLGPTYSGPADVLECPLATLMVGPARVAAPIAPPHQIFCRPGYTPDAPPNAIAVNK